MSVKDHKIKTTLKGVFEVLEQYFKDFQDGMTFEVIGVVDKTPVINEKVAYLTLKTVRKSHTGKSVNCKYNLSSFDKEMMELLKKYNEGDVLHVTGYVASQYYLATEKFYTTHVIKKIKHLNKEEK